LKQIAAEAHKSSVAGRDACFSIAPNTPLLRTGRALARSAP
jgi:hypothetical protein